MGRDIYWVRPPSGTGHYISGQGRGRGGRSLIMWQLNLRNPPIKPCGILMIPLHWQSIFFSPSFKFCWRQLIPPSFPLVNHVTPYPPVENLSTSPSPSLTITFFSAWIDESYFIWISRSFIGNVKSNLLGFLPRKAAHSLLHLVGHWSQGFLLQQMWHFPVFQTCGRVRWVLSSYTCPFCWHSARFGTWLSLKKMNIQCHLAPILIEIFYAI